MNNNVQHVKVKEEQFFKLWINMLQPFLKLRNQEVDLLAKLLYHRYIISQEVADKDLVDNILFSSETRKRMRQELKFEVYTFNNTLLAIRKKKIVIDKSINKVLIPNVDKDFEKFTFTYSINIQRDVDTNKKNSSAKENK